MKRRSARAVAFLAAAFVAVAGCSLGLFTDPPADGAADANDADGLSDADVGADADGDDDGGEATPICGDGTPEGDEECDDGNFEALDGCDNACRFTCHAGTDCDDGNQCTSDLCAVGGTGQLCTNPLTTGESCDDGNPCSGGDTCAADGTCAGTAGECACGADIDCVPYDDTDLCNGVLRCNTSAGFCEIDPASVVRCDTSGDTTCTHTVCVPATGLCVPDLADDGTVCDDGDYCSVDSTCQAGVCQRTGSDTPCTDRTCSTGCDEASDSCIPAGAGTTCRPADPANLCDLPENCDGSSPDCPTDQFRPSGYECRAGGGDGSCDPAESCTGRHPECPADYRLPHGAACLGGTGVCCAAGRDPVCQAGTCCSATDTGTCTCQGPSSRSCAFFFTQTTCTNGGCYWDRTVGGCRGVVDCRGFAGDPGGCTGAGCRSMPLASCRGPLTFNCSL
jgi:cysteine-rich repeat protein